MHGWHQRRGANEPKNDAWICTTQNVQSSNVAWALINGHRFLSRSSELSCPLEWTKKGIKTKRDPAQIMLMELMEHCVRVFCLIHDCTLQVSSRSKSHTHTLVVYIERTYV